MNEIDWKFLIELRKRLDCRVRLGIRATGESSEWSTTLFEPSPSYVEIPSYGPVKKADVESLDFDPVVVTTVGRLLPDRTNSVEDDFSYELKSRGIPFEKVGEFIRVTFQTAQAQ